MAPTSASRPDSMRGNRNAVKPGQGVLMLVRFPDGDAYQRVLAALSPAERGSALLEAARAVEAAALAIIGDCAQCGEPVSAAEGLTDGLCASCAALAAAAQ